MAKGSFSESSFLQMPCDSFTCDSTLCSDIRTSDEDRQDTPTVSGPGLPLSQHLSIVTT